MRVLGAAAAAPVLVAQALHVRRVTPRLPGAAGPVDGFVAGRGEPFRLAVLGESTADGVGAATHDEALAGQLARALARDGRAVSWQVVGRTGANAGTVRDELAPLVRPADLVLVALGVNDTTELHTATRYRRDLLSLVVTLRRRLGQVDVVLAGVPPMGRFPGLPRPLRDVLAARSAALDTAAAELARLPRVLHAPMRPTLLDDTTFAEDRFHPGPIGYARWAGELADTYFRHFG